MISPKELKHFDAKIVNSSQADKLETEIDLQLKKQHINSKCIKYPHFEMLFVDNKYSEDEIYEALERYYKAGWTACWKISHFSPHDDYIWIKLATEKFKDDMIDGFNIVPKNKEEIINS